MTDSRITITKANEDGTKFLVAWPIVKTTLTNGHQTIRRANPDEAHTGFAYKVGTREVCERQL